jgi:RHS repeat-associated protein
VFAAFTTAAKEETFSAFGPWCAETCISESECEGEKPHQGVAGKNPALHQGIVWSNSTTALGLRSLAVENRVRSRCTGKERDGESGLDMFGARYYGSSLGRFMTPDWATKPTAVPYAHYGNPQSLNLYSYVQNNPTTTGDPDGHCPWCLAVAGGGVLADEAPLAFTGPVGWTVIGVTALGVGGYALYQNFHSSDNSNTANAPAPQSAPAPSTTPAPAAGSPHAPGDVADGQTVVRGGQGAIPSSGTYSGAQGATIEEAGKGVPHGTVSATTGGEIRAAGGEVRPAPEPAYPGGPVNGQHVNVTGGQSAFGPQQANPAPKSERVPSAPKPPKPGDSQ